MSDEAVDFPRLEDIRPQILALLQLYRTAQTEEARAGIASLFERAFLATAWNVAQDMLENGWTPGFAPTPRGPRTLLKLVGGSDAA